MRCISIQAILLFVSFNLTPAHATGRSENQPYLDIAACEKLKGNKRSQCFENFAKQQAIEKHKNNENDVFISNLIDELKNELTNNFKDPTSAIYRSTSLRKNISEERYALCGEVNAKNSYGGYIGFQRFVSKKYPNGQSTKSLEGDMSSKGVGSDSYTKQLNALMGDIFQTVWDINCAESEKNELLRDNIN